MQTKVERYERVVAWIQGFDNLSMSLQDLGEELSLEEQERVLSYMRRNVVGWIKFAKGAREKRKTVQQQLQLVLPKLRRGRIYSNLELLEKVNELTEYRYAPGVLTRPMRNLGREFGFARVDIGLTSWLKPSRRKTDYKIPAKPAFEESLPENEKIERNWRLIIEALEQTGYCESPLIFSTDIARGCIGSRSLSRAISFREWEFRTYMARNSGRYESRYKYVTEGGSKLRKFAKDPFSQSAFDMFVTQTGLPTAEIRGKKVLVYHPRIMREVQGLKRV